MKNISTIILLVLIAIVGVFTLDVYLPGMPAMASEFGVSIDKICLTFTTFSIIFAISQLFHGVLSDYFGRKPILLVGLSIAAIATVYCINAKTYETLFLARILQAVGISVFVVMNAIIRDLYTGAIAIRLRILVNTVSGISISIAPTIGGSLLNRFDWQGGFLISLFLIVATLIYAAIFFPETNTSKKRSALSLTSFIKSYAQLFLDKNYFLQVLMVMLAYTIHFSFIVMSAKIFIDVLGFTPLIFGYLMFIYGGIYFINGFITTYLSKKLQLADLIKLGGIFIGAGGAGMLILSMVFPLNAWGILFPMSIITLGVTTVRSAGITGALSETPEQAGQGAAGINLIQFMLSAIIATGVSQLGIQPQISLSILASVCSISIIALMNLFNQTHAVPEYKSN